MPTPAFEANNIPRDEDEPGVLTPTEQKQLLDFDYFSTTEEEVEKVKDQQDAKMGKKKTPAPGEELEDGAEGEAEAEVEAEEEEGSEDTEEGEEEVAAAPALEDRQFQTELLTAVKSLQQPPLPRPGAQPAAEEDPLPSYNFQVKKEIADALASEDANVRAAAINAIANGVAMNVHAQVRAETAQRTRQIVANYVASQGAQRDQAKEIEQDFYGNYPELNKPAIRAAVVTVAQSLYDGKGPWTPILRKKIAEETARQLGIKLAGPAGQQSGSGAERNTQSGAAANNGKPGRKPPKVLAGAARPGTPKSKGSVQDDIADTLFGSDGRR